MVAVALVWIAVVAVAGADGTSLTGYIPGLLLLTSLISALHARSERRAPDRS
jgi:hypothetical protein